MARRYYILKDGERLYRDTLEAISNAAKREANRIGEGVQVHYEEKDAFGNASGRRGPAARHTPTAAGRLSYARNPVNPHLKTASVEMLSFLRGRDITATQARQIKAIAAKAPVKRLPKASKAAKRSPGKDAVAARKAGYSEADNPYEPGTMGHTIWQRKFRENPATKASKARRVASNKRGAFVEYKDGTQTKRIKYGNKGIATIRATAMKRDGWRGVRVVSA